MFNFKPIDKLNRSGIHTFLVCFSCCAMASSCLFGQQIIRQNTPVPAYQLPYQGAPVYPQRQYPVNPQQYPQYPNAQNPGRIIYSQPGQNQISPPQQQGFVLPSPAVQNIPTPRANSTVVPNNSAIAKQNDELKRRLVAGSKKLKQLTADNGKLKEKLGQYDTALRKARDAYSEANTELAELRKRPAQATEPNMPAVDVEAFNTAIQQQKDQIAELESQIAQLNALQREAAKQNEAMSGQIKILSDENSGLNTELANLRSAGSADTQKLQNELSAQIKTLTDENSSLNAELANLRSAGGPDTQKLQTELAEKSARLNELQQTFGTVKSESQRLQNLAETANAENAKITQRLNHLSSENEQLQTQLRTALSNAQATPAPAPVVKAPTPAVVKTPVTSTTSHFVSNRRSEAANVKAENRQLLASAEQSQKENELLKRRILELESSSQGQAIEKNDRQQTAGAALSLEYLVPSDSGESKFAIMRWLLPFLGIGLAIGLYVFLTEENEAGVPRNIAERRDTTD